MKPMGDLKQAQAAITRGLDAGELGTNGSQRCESSLSASVLKPLLPVENVERLTAAEAARRERIKEMIQRYHAEKNLEPLGDDDLTSYVVSFDQHFTYAGIPTRRIGEVYLEAMAHHGPWLLKIDDYLRAWERIRPDEGRGADTRPMGERGIGCSICGGSGMAKVYLPSEGVEVVKECPYHCRVVTSLARCEQ